MNIARCRSIAAFIHLRSFQKGPAGAAYVRSFTSTSVYLKAKKRTESFDFDSLPKSRLDNSGAPVKSLEPWKEYKKAHHAPSVEVADDEESLYREAVAAGDIPDTALAKQVYLNWKRFPDCIVLTRVGKFYEASCPRSAVSGADEFSHISPPLFNFRLCSI
jgi:hypothetical protein